MAITKRKSLDELPVFRNNPFDKKSDVPVFEFAFLISKTIPATTPPYKFAMPVAVVGKAPDSETIYFSRQAMWMPDGSVMAVHPSGTEGYIGEERRAYLETYVSVPVEDVLPLMKEAFAWPH